jgi:hypothetical protein
MSIHRFHTDKIAFNPTTTFITNLWNSEFFWILLDSPSGISIFYCLETKSLNTFELERDRNLALADKVNNSDLKKLAKQKIFLPTSLMDLVWSTQNFHAVIALCFGHESHSASFLQNWIDHMYENRLLYTSLQPSNPYFFAKVMFTTNNALQIQWHSCSSAPNRSSVNDNILHMTDTQDLILRLNFSQMLPNTISDKVMTQLGLGKDEKGKGLGQGKQLGKCLPAGNQEKQDLVYDNGKSHHHWRIKDNENFAKIFYKNQRECPKTSEGKLICMIFFLQGICTKTCTRTHTLSSKDASGFLGRDRISLVLNSSSPVSNSLEPSIKSRKLKKTPNPKHPSDSSSLSINNLFSGESLIVDSSSAANLPFTGNHCRCTDTAHAASSIPPTLPLSESTTRQGTYFLILSSIFYFGATYSLQRMMVVAFPLSVIYIDSLSSSSLTPTPLFNSSLLLFTILFNI